MKESSTQQQPEPETPAERPSWRFSGRRGTPVHLREQAPATLPPEIRKAIVQMAREQSGEAAAAPQAKSSTQRRDVSLGDARAARAVIHEPPVAAAPMPVERRAARSADAVAVVTTSPIEGPPPLASAIELSGGPSRTPVTMEAPAVEAPQVDVKTPRSADVEAVPTSTPTAGEPPPAGDADATPAPPATAADPVRVAASRAKAKARSRSKAKARAKARAKAKADVASRDGSKPRRIFARGLRVTDPLAEGLEPAIEPTVEDVPPAEVDAGRATPIEDVPVVEADAGRATPIEDVPVVEVDAGRATPPIADVPVVEVDAGRATPIEDVPVVEVDAGRATPPIEDVPVVEVPLVAASAADDEEPVAGDVVEFPDPIAARESSQQAAWELGRLPFLLHAVADQDGAAEHAAAEPEPEPEPVAEMPRPEAPPATPAPAPTEPRPAAEPVAPAERGARPVELRPIAWGPIDRNPEPAPFPASDEDGAVPTAIARLQDPLLAPERRATLGSSHARANGASPAARAAGARHHLERRRAELRELVGSLPGSCPEQR